MESTREYHRNIRATKKSQHVTLKNRKYEYIFTVRVALENRRLNSLTPSTTV